MRPATADDAAAVLAIYAPVVQSTPISFGLPPPTREEMARRIRATTRHPWLVAVADGGVAGYAYAAPHKDRPAYRWSVDTSVYVHQAWRSRGVGPALLSGPPAEGITVERARTILEGVLAWHGNPRLKLGTVEEQNEDTIVAEILTVDDSLVQRLAINRATRTFRRID